MNNDFYTYAYLREDRTPYYIGKGRGNRAFKKSRAFKPPEDKKRILFLKKGLDEEQAFRHEIYMIAVFGRKDLGTGILHNKTNGGDGSSGVIRSRETREKISASLSGGNHPRYGITGEANPLFGVARPEHSERMIGEMNPMYGRTGELNPNYGKKWWVKEDGETYLGAEPPGPEWQRGRKWKFTNP
jgi:hypothetical protein